MVRKLTPEDLAERRAQGRAGYGCPPQENQFQPGQSGNVKGRSAKPKDLSDAIQKELTRMVTVTENGKKKRVMMLAIVSKQLVRSAASGNIKAIEKIFSHDREARQRVQAAAAQKGISLEADLLTLREIAEEATRTPVVSAETSESEVPDSKCDAAAL